MTDSRWIAALVEQCLSCYLNQTEQNAIEVEDDGERLTFSNNGFAGAALVTEWGRGRSGDQAVLMDADNQIEATISPVATSTYGSEPSKKQSIQGGLRKRRVELLDFKLVFTYLAAAPDVRLHVNRFRVDWDKGLVGFVPTKMLRKNQIVKPLLSRASQKARASRQSAQLHEPIGKHTASEGGQYRHSDITESHPSENGESQQLLSQNLSLDQDTFDRSSSAVRSRPNMSSELLKHLGPSSLSKLNCTSSSSSKSRDSTVRNLTYSKEVLMEDVSVSRNRDTLEPPHKPATDEGVMMNSSQDLSREDSISSQPKDEHTAIHKAAPRDSSLQETQSQTSSRNASFVSCDASRGPQDDLDVSVVKKRPRESPDVLMGSGRIENIESASRSNSPSRKRQRTGATQGVSANKLGTMEVTNEPIQPQNSESDAHDAVSCGLSDPAQATVDPWEGLVNISTRQVTIPKDQLRLFEDNICWIPPAAGDIMPQGHVPPLLLAQWNRIAERRYRLARDNNGISEKPATPTQGTILSSQLGEDSSPGTPYSWGEDSPRSQGRSRLSLPPDSSPIKQPVSTRRDLTSASGEDGHRSLTMSTANMMNSNRTPNPSQLEEVDGPLTNSNSETRLPRCSQHVEINKETSENDIVLDQVSLETTDSLEQVANQDTLNTFENRTTQPPAPSAYPESRSEFKDDDSDDEAPMDTSIPLPLGGSWPESTQCSQIEQEIRSSGISLLLSDKEHVQVAETPVIGINRLRDSNLSEGHTRSGHYGLQTSPPSAHKTSSQSRILNTYPYHSSHEKSQSSYEDLDPSGQSGSLLPGDTLEAQILTGSNKTQSQSQSQPDNPTQQFALGIELDSSQPARPRIDFYLWGPHPPDEPSLLSSNMRTETSSQSNELNREKVDSSQVSRLGHSDPAALTENQFLLKSSTDSPPVGRDDSQALLDTQSATLVARRQGFIGNADMSAEAQEVYSKFCIDYPNYTGDFNHFKELCSKLQAIRANGQLQRSFLWDDFVIVHLLEYPRHVEERRLQDTQPLRYEQYFSDRGSRPLFKKRSLTLHGIDLVASQFISTALSSESVNVPDLGAYTNEPTGTNPLMTDLAGQISDHAHPICDVSGTNHAEKAHSHTSETRPTSRASLVNIKREGSESDHFTLTATQLAPVNTSAEEPAFSSLESNMDHEIRVEILNTNRTFKRSNCAGMEDVEETDTEDSRHETASIELGDDSFVLDRQISESRDLSENKTEPEDENEDWFRSLRYMRPVNPVWSDDPETPFKRWARADQNVVSERVYHRGGANILLDAKGVIRRPIHR